MNIPYFWYVRHAADIVLFVFNHFTVPPSAPKCAIWFRFCLFAPYYPLLQMLFYS